MWRLGTPSQSIHSADLYWVAAGGRPAELSRVTAFWNLVAQIKSGQEAGPSPQPGPVDFMAPFCPFLAGCSLKVLADSERYTWIVL